MAFYLEMVMHAEYIDDTHSRRVVSYTSTMAQWKVALVIGLVSKTLSNVTSRAQEASYICH